MRAVDDLWASEARFRALVEHSHDAIALLDRSFRVVWGSDACERLLGRPPRDLVGVSADDLLHPDDRDEVVARFADLARNPGMVASFEMRGRHADGSWRWYEATASNRLAEPAVGCYVLNFTDVTERHATVAALEASEARFRALVHLGSDVAVILRPDGTVSYVSASIEPMLGHRPEDLIGTSGFALIHPDDVDAAVNAAAGLLAGDPVDETTVRIAHGGGGWRWVEITGTDLTSEEAVGGLGLTLRDVTERVLAEDAIREREERFRALVQNASDVVQLMDATGRILWVSPALRTMLGWDPDEMTGLYASLYAHPDELPEISHLFRDLVAGRVTGPVRAQSRVLHRDGSVRWVDTIMSNHLDDPAVRAVVANFRDITERVTLEEQLEHEASHDPLTGLPNRTLLLDRLAMALARARRHDQGVALIFCDLDHFKVVNDSLGHGFGDRLLIEIAERLSTVVRPGDTVARFGGDEFVILCEEIDGEADAFVIAERLEQAVSGRIEIDDAEVFVTLSAGIAFGGPDHPPESLLRDADSAMYRAKDNGRARFEVFDEQMRRRAIDRLATETALRRAVDGGELLVHYQPEVDLVTGTVIGVEALVRWDHPDRGVLAPREFITVAEDTGLIVPLGTQVLAAACRQLVAWDAELGDRSPRSLGVNLSARQLSGPTLVADLRAVLRDAGVEPDRLVLEITESVVMDDPATTAATLHRLRDLGVRLAVDDFGTGYSSLAYLKRFPVDILKVDREFVDGLGRDPEDSAIVAAIVTLAHTLGLQAIAEGVETEQQLDVLRRLGCDLAQGFLLGRPAPADQLAALLGEQRQRV